MSEEAHDAILARSGAVMPVLSRSLRAMFTAAPGHVLLGADFSNIEGRLNAWFAGEDWKLRAFRDYDVVLPGQFDKKGKPKRAGPDLYKVAYARTFGVDIDDVTDQQRQKGGKTQELALGFQGSCGAWLRFDPDPTIVVALVKERYHGQDNWKKAEEQHDRLKFHNGLSAEQWTALKVVVNGWRETNPRITQMWWAMQDAVIEAVDSPGTTVTICDGRIKYLASDGFLWTRLPSGKLLAYANARLAEKRDDWLVDEDGNAVPADEMSADEIELRVAAGCVLQEGQRRLSVVYDGVGQKAGGPRRWGKQYLYGGVLCNNAVQATARELLRFAMHRVEEAGWPIVLHVHDEVVCEVPESGADVAVFERVMSALPPWLEGLPLAAKAWTSSRYVK